jgi:hypothetical protein
MTGSGTSTCTNNKIASIALALVPALADERHFSTIPGTATPRVLRSTLSPPLEGTFAPHSSRHTQ